MYNKINCKNIFIGGSVSGLYGVKKFLIVIKSEVGLISQEGSFKPADILQ